jgi:hypothetical protein
MSETFEINMDDDNTILSKHFFCPHKNTEEQEVYTMEVKSRTFIITRCLDCGMIINNAGILFEQH